MIDWLPHLPVFWMAFVVFSATFLVTGLIFVFILVISKEKVRTFKAMSPVMLTPLAVVFGLLIGFLSAQVWSDADRANAALTREASALRTVILCANVISGNPAERIRALVRQHIENAVKEQWPAMAKHLATLEMDTPSDTEALQLTLSLALQGDAQLAAQREMVSAWQNAPDARRQRIIISRSLINWVKWSVVIVLAALIQITIAIVHSDNRATAAIAMTIFGVGVAVCLVLLASHNRPFTGEISVSPDLLLQVMPQK